MAAGRGGEGGGRSAAAAVGREAKMAAAIGACHGLRRIARGDRGSTAGRDLVTDVESGGDP